MNFVTYYLFNHYSIYDCALNVVEINIRITRKVHFPLGVYFWLISGSVLESKGVSCPKWVIIRKGK